MLALVAWVAGEAGAQGLPAGDGFDLGVRVQVDHSDFRGVTTINGDPSSATWLRRVDASARWQWNPQWQFSAEVAHDAGELVLGTAVLSWQPVAGMRLQAGRVDADFGLDNTNSSSWSVGIERSAIWDLVPGVGDVGQGWSLRADGHGHGWHASVGRYTQVDSRAVVGRAVWILKPQPQQVWQLGASLAHRQGLDDRGLLRTRLGLRGVTEDDAGRRSELAAEVDAPQRYRGDTALALEAAAQQGAWLMQAEAVFRRLQPSGGAPPRAAAGHTVQLAWSPSGLPRRHDPKAARFGRPEGDERVGGRWEVFVRHDALRVTGGMAARVQTVGASWFLGRHWRGSVNAVANRSDDPNAVGDRRGWGWVVRLQAVF